MDYYPQFTHDGTKRFNLITGFIQQIFYFLLYFWLCWVFVGVHWLSLVAASEGRSLVVVRGRLIEGAGHFGSMGSRQVSWE